MCNSPEGRAEPNVTRKEILVGSEGMGMQHLFPHLNISTQSEKEPTLLVRTRFLPLPRGLSYNMNWHLLFSRVTQFGAGEGGLGTAHEINIKVWDGSLSGRKEAKGEITPWENFFFLR